MLIDSRQVFAINDLLIARAMPSGQIKLQKERSVDVRKCLQFSNFTAVGPEGVLRDGRQLIDPMQLSYDRIRDRVSKWYRQPNSEQEMENQILLAGKNFSSEGHFVYQHVPRLLTLMREYSVTPDKWTLLVNPKHGPDTAKWLSNYGLPEFKVKELSKSTRLFSGLYCSMPRSYTDSLNEIDLRVWGNAENTTKSLLDSVVFVTRGKKAKRKILNEPQLIGALLKRAPNLQIIDYSTQQFVHLKTIIKSATLIVGASGMGLSPSVMNRQASMFVLGNKYHPFNWHTRFAIPAAFSGNIAATLNARSADAPYGYHDDFDYPVELFTAQLDQLIGLATQH